MMVYSLFIASFGVLINFSIGVSYERKIELKTLVYSSYADAIESLEANELEYLDDFIEKIYNAWYEFAIALEEFTEENDDLMRKLKDASSKTFNCLAEEIMDSLNNYERIINKLHEEIYKYNENATCYNDLQMYFRDIIRNFEERIMKDKTYKEVYNYFQEASEITRELEDNEFTMEGMFRTARIAAEIFIVRMVEEVKKTDDKEEIRRISQRIVEELGEADDLIVEGREDFMNVEEVEELIERHEWVYHECRGSIWKLSCARARIQNLTLTDIAKIKKYTNVKIYIIDDENNKKELDCDDHFPLTNRKPTEKVIYVFSGTDKDGQNYNRTFQSEDVEDIVFLINETIEYEDKKVDGQYIFDFENVLSST